MDTVDKIHNKRALHTDSRVISGTAAVFNSESENIGFIEILLPGSITEETIKKSDIVATYNHDESKILARSRNGEGSLKLTVDETGLHYEFEAPNTPLGDEILEMINRGDLSKSSFAFTVAKGGERWYKKEDVTYREISKIEELFDVSVVVRPAYEDTSCQTRSKAEAIETISKYINK